MNKTKINYISDSWTRIKNHCRTTVNKKFTENKPTEDFKEKLLISEHSPIRLLEVDWTWQNVPYWVSTEWSRHKFEKFITSQRDDRMIDEIPRGQKPQDAPVSYDGYANSQNLVDSFRKRLCYQATKEARELAEDFKSELKTKEPKLSDVLVPNCVYRGGCPEFSMCKERFFAKFLNCCKNKNINFYNISERYKAYNEMFCEERKENK